MSVYFPVPAENSKLMIEIYRLILVTGGGLAIIFMSQTFEWAFFWAVFAPGGYALVMTLYIQSLERKARESHNAERDSVRIYEGRRQGPPPHSA